MLRRLFPNVYEGWLVVISAALLVLIMGSIFFYGFGTIFNEIIDEFHWSHGVTALGFSLRSEVGGIAAPFVGAAIDRLGARRVMAAGIVVSSSGIFALSAIQSLWQFYLAILVIAIGASAAGGPVGLAAIATWFDRRRSSAMALMTVGGGLGGLLVIAVAYIVEEFGWRGALRILALFMLTVGMLVAMNVRSRPDDHPQPMDGKEYWEPDGTPAPRRVAWGIPWRPAIRSRSFLLLTAGLICLNFSVTAVVILQIPYLENEIGVSKTAAGVSVFFFTTVSIIGRLFFGILADRVPKATVLAASSALVMLGLPVMALANSYPMALLGICIVAPGFGGLIPVRPALMADYYGTRYFGTINGIGQLVNTTGGAIGPLAVGILVDVTGAYRDGWLLSAVIAGLAIPIFLAMRPPTELAEQYRNQPPPAPPAPSEAAPEEPTGPRS